MQLATLPTGVIFALQPQSPVEKTLPFLHTSCTCGCIGHREVLGTFSQIVHAQSCCTPLVDAVAWLVGNHSEYLQQVVVSPHIHTILCFDSFIGPSIPWVKVRQG